MADLLKNCPEPAFCSMKQCRKLIITCLFKKIGISETILNNIRIYNFSVRLGKLGLLSVQ